MAKIARTLVFTDDQLEAALDRWEPARKVLDSELEYEDQARAWVIDFLRSEAAHKLYVMSTHPMNDSGRGD